MRLSLSRLGGRVPFALSAFLGLLLALLKRFFLLSYLILSYLKKRVNRCFLFISFLFAFYHDIVRRERRYALGSVLVLPNLKRTAFYGVVGGRGGVSPPLMDGVCVR